MKANFLPTLQQFDYKAQKQSIISYIRTALRPDLVAGLTLAMIVIPQSMAYAQIANLHPIYGVFTAILPAIVGSIFGSSNHLHTGPTNATAMVVFSVLVAYADSPQYPDLVFTLAIFSGILLLILGILRLGTIVRFMSNSVLTGFLTGATILIILGQLNGLLGLKIPRALGTIDTIIAAISSLSSANPYVVIISCLSILMMLLVPRINNRLPAALITVLTTSTVVYLTDWQKMGVIIVGDLGLPLNPEVSFYLPKFDLRLLPDLADGIIAVTIIKLVETISISKSIAMKSGQRLNTSREFIGQGLASFVGGFFQCFPPSGSLSRSAINFKVGGKSRLASTFSGIFVWIALVAASTILGYIPVSSLAAIVVVSALGLMNIPHMKFTWKARKVSRLVMVVTFLATLFSSPENAIYLGATLSIVIYLVESRHLTITFIKVSPNGEFIETDQKGILNDNPAIVLTDVEGDFFFGAVDELEEKLTPILDSGVKVLIIRVRRLRLMSSTGVTSIHGLIDSAHRKGVKVVICGVKDSISKLLENSGVSAALGNENIYFATDTLHESTMKALNRAHDLADQFHHSNRS